MHFRPGGVFGKEVLADIGLRAGPFLDPESGPGRGLHAARQLWGQDLAPG